MRYLLACPHFRPERLPGTRFLCYLSTIRRDGCGDEHAYSFPLAPYILLAHIMVQPV